MSNRQIAERFADQIIQLVLLFGGERSTAYKCAAVWWDAIERGDFDSVAEPSR